MVWFGYSVSFWPGAFGPCWMLWTLSLKFGWRMFLGKTNYCDTQSHGVVLCAASSPEVLKNESLTSSCQIESSDVISRI